MNQRYQKITKTKKIKSGSGGGGYIPPQRNEFDCETSFIITNVSSIDLTALAKHTVGIFLDVIIGDNEEDIFIKLPDKDKNKMEMPLVIYNRNTNTNVRIVIPPVDVDIDGY